MFNHPRKTFAVAVVCVLLFAAGMGWLFWLRFDAGNLYPPYSSLRSDPLGTQVLYESLMQIRVDGVQRNFRALDQIHLADTHTLLMCGLYGDESRFRGKSWEHILDEVSTHGGRLVLMFRSSSHRSQAKDDEVEPECDADEPESDSPKGPKDGNVTQEVPENLDIDISSWLGVFAKLGVSLETHSEKPETDIAVRTAHAPAFLPEVIPWRTQRYFDLNDPQWQTLYRWQDHPVLVTRPWGAGQVMMATDSYLFSNEALRNDRFSQLLTWVIGPSRTVIMDESHLGLMKQPGIASLLRKYRLQGVVAAVGVVLILLIWRQSIVFVVRPVNPDAGNKEMETGVDTSEGVMGLMQQHIASKQLLSVCFNAWNGSAAASRVPDDVMGKIQQVLAGYNEKPHSKKLITAYRDICELLKQGTHS